MSKGKRGDELETWMLGLKDLAASRGHVARLAYADRVAGDALVLALDDGERDDLVELHATRRPRGRAHLAVMATTAAGAARAHDWLTRAHAEIPRFANARRKFAHRFVRLIDQLARSFAERAVGGPTEALDRLRAILGEAVASTGVGFHVELAGGDAEHHTRERYPTLHGAAVLVDGRWRTLPYDPRPRGWAPRAAAYAALLAARPGLDPARAGIVVDPEDAGVIDAGAAAAVGAGAVIGAAVVASEVQAVTERKRSSWVDCVDPCDVLDVCDLGSSLADLGNCVPDCNFDLDCGSLDCSW